MSDAPAMTVAKVRMIGTKRASRMVRLPLRSKKACDLCTYSALNSRLSGRLNTAGPSRRPIQ
ncbi:unannotated protein [freshwater metagenome]|uniref:Unannotated protein n=1 Tax=freshwater metagenome TaxID=449393 RepID=A0A6J7G3Z0_9ZZZZ